ncbi:heme exporter protein CcmB [uncultured Algimonas sp.]|uniref:heme exporter protein CcmB n=1 Tax=uncultured Algimonas sp. TaxID=1547920 RepID=UPI0026359006|nr:heme exporter protein CcmB [uncultured Algimonas sp.]
MMRAILLRDLRLAARGASGTGLSLAFMALFVLLCGLALGGSQPALGPGLLWLAATLSALLGLDRFYQPDQETGALAQMHHAGASETAIATAKCLSFALTAIIPLILAAPFLALLLGMDGPSITGTVLSLIVGAPALTAYASVTGALLAGQRSGGVLAVILTAPLLIPVLIFGTEAANVFAADGLATVQFRILAGLSFIAVALGLPATVAALAANRGA